MGSESYRKLAEEKLTDVKRQILRYHKSLVVAVGSLTIVGTGTLWGAHYYKENQVPLYQVYVNEEMVGIIEDPAVVEEWLDRQIASVRREVPDAALKFSRNVTISEPEMVFKGEGEETAVLDVLEEEVEVEAEAVQLVIDGKPAAVLADIQAVDTLLEAVRGAYTGTVSAVGLRSHRTDRSADRAAGTEEAAPAFKEVRFLEEVEQEPVNVAPEEIQDLDEVYRLVQEGIEEEKRHTVQEGETLSEIAASYEMDTKDLLRMNPDLSEETLLQIGQKVVVKAKEPLISVLTVEKKVEKEKVPFETEVKKSNEMYKGEQKVTQEGKDGLKEVTYELTRVNGILQGKSIVAESMLKEPVKQVIVKGTKVLSERGTGDFAWPAAGGYISSSYGSRWGRFHRGIDIARPSSRGVKAADNGRVVSAGWDGGYGYSVVIDHNNGYQTRYAHLSRIKVSVGQVVERGQSIGMMGATGNATGTHLHFEVMKNGRTINPRGVL